MCNKGGSDTSLLVSDKASSRSLFVGEEDIGEFDFDFGLSRGRGETLLFGFWVDVSYKFDFGLSRGRRKMLLFGFWEDIGGGVVGEVKISLVDLNVVSPSFVFVFLVDAAARWNMNMSSRIFNTNAKEVVVHLSILHFHC